MDFSEAIGGNHPSSSPSSSQSGKNAAGSLCFLGRDTFFWFSGTLLAALR
jgi:hypothetical protein